LHILHYLSNDGIAVVLNFPGILYRGNSEGILRKWLIENNFIDKIVRIPSKSFIDTTIETVLVIFKKNKFNTNIEVIDKETNKSKIVSIDEITKNDFTLSCNMYLSESKKEVTIDKFQLMKDARLDNLRRLKADIELDKMICMIENWDCHKDYINELKQVLIKAGEK